MPVYTIQENYQGKSAPPKLIQYEINERGCWICVSHNSNTPNRRPRVKRNRKQLILSRYIYKLLKGDFPEELDILHSCDDLNCINPEHLRPGTAGDNVNDRMERDRGYHSETGVNHFNANITKEMYFKIVKSHEKGLPQKEIKELLSLTYNKKVASKVISAIVRGFHWSCEEYDPERKVEFIPTTQKRQRKVTLESYNRIMEMRNEGLHAPAICEDVGLGRYTVLKILRGQHWSCKEFGGANNG